MYKTDARRQDRDRLIPLKNGIALPHQPTPAILWFRSIGAVASDFVIDRFRRKELYGTPTPQHSMDLHGPTAI